MVFVGSVRVWWMGLGVWELRIVCGGRGGVGGFLVECAGMLCRCLEIACSVWVVIYYAALLLFLLCFVVLLSCVISWAYTGFLRGVFVFFRTWG